MGTIRKYICQDCGYSWNRREGTGMLFAVLYCDKCGDCKELKPSNGNHDETDKCACGGTYRLETRTARCPKCQSINTIPDNGIIALWD